MTGNIAVIYTGGTIGMQPGSGGLAPAPMDAGQLAGLAGLKADFDLIVLEPLLDSAECVPADWLRIGAAIAHHYDVYSAFIILHGTDTMAFTAASLAYQLRGLGKPVVLTGSQLPLSAEGSDAPANLALAFKAAARPGLQEVVVAFGKRVMRGTRVKKLSTHGFIGFESPNAIHLATVTDRKTAWHDDAFLVPDGVFAPHVEPMQQDAVMSVRLAPGISVETLRAGLASRYKAIILEVYGAGTGPVNNKDFMAFLAEARNRGISVVAVTQCPWGTIAQGTYAAGSALAAAGVASGGDITFEAAWAKLHHLVSLGLEPEHLGRAFATPLAGDMG